MKRLLGAFFALIPASGFAADPSGMWHSQPRNSGGYVQVKVSACADDPALFCGTIVQVFDGADAKNIGKQMLWNLKANGDNKWKGGKIWAPGIERTFNASMVLDGDVLHVKGCVAVVCNTQDWTRVQ